MLEENIEYDDTSENSYITNVSYTTYDSNNNRNNSLYELEKSIRSEIKKNQSHTNKFKLLIVDLARNYGRGGKQYAANVGHCSLSSVYDWEKLYDKIRKQKNQDMKRIAGGGRKSIVSKYEKDILYWIINHRKLGLIISIKSIITYLLSEHQELKSKSFHDLYNIIYNMLKRNGFSIRKASHIGQKLPDNASYSFYEFIQKVIKERDELGIYDDEEYRIINCDETPIFLENPDTKTIDFKGSKQILIDTQGNEKEKVTVLLTIMGDGSKLEPLMVFKGKRGKNIEKDLQTNENVLKKNMYVYSQGSSWVDAEIFSKWYKYIFLPYEAKIGKKCLLIMDKAPSHTDSYIIKKLKKHDTHFVFIPGGLTRYLQPLDIGINKVFKSAIKDEYIHFTIERRRLAKLEEDEGVDVRLLRHQLINSVAKIWKDDKCITKENIKNSFFKSSITFKMDGTDDNEFKFPNELDEIDSIYDDAEYDAHKFIGRLKLKKGK